VNGGRDPASGVRNGKRRGDQLRAEQDIVPEVIPVVAHQVDSSALASRVIEALRTQFPFDTVAIEPGYLGRLHLKIVSEQFNGLDEQAKQDMVWTILRNALAEDSEDVAFVIPYGTDEL
jgi:hypothetical protein